jgi:hypothetical protein
MPLLLIVDVGSFVGPAILPGELSLTVHLVVEPFAEVVSAVGPLIVTVPLYLILVELTLVLAPIGPVERALTLLQAGYIVAGVAGSVGPSLIALAMLHVVLPLAICDDSLVRAHTSLPVSRTVYEITGVYL